MAIYNAYDAKGLREDLADVIYSISPTDTPFQSSVGRTKATAVYHEWQTDALAAATTNNAAVEGADASDATLSPTVRLGNYTQILQKTIKVSGTLDAVNKAGRKSEKAYQLAKASAEIKRDLETILLANQGQTAGSSNSSARKMGSLLSWLKTNTQVVTATNNPTTIGVSTRTDGSQRTFTEQLLKDAVADVFESGGNPKVLMVGPAGKQKVSSFAGIAAQRFMAPANTPTTIIGAADVYMSDFGTMSVVPNRFMRARDALVLDPEYAAVAYLRPFQTNELAKAGDSDKTQILVECTLEVKNEAAHALIADLDMSL
jgi:phage gpG-like protein